MLTSNDWKYKKLFVNVKYINGEKNFDNNDTTVKKLQKIIKKNLTYEKNNRFTFRCE